MLFKDIPAHDEIKCRLRRMVDTGRIPHALLLEGPTGSYKLSLARAMAQYIHCTNRTTDGDACGRCPSCLQHQGFNHLDTIYSYPFVKPDGSQNAVSDDYAAEWRSFLDKWPTAPLEEWAAGFDKKNAQPIYYVSEAVNLQHKLVMSNRGARFRIAILWLVERMNTETANKLLKLIEEPAKDTLLIMTADNPRDILPTVYSRLQRVEVPRLGDTVVAQVLTARGVDPVEAAAISHTVDGDVNAAIRSTLRNSPTKKRFDLFTQLMRLAYMRKVHDLKLWAASINDLGREEAVRFYRYAQHLVRENFVYNFQHPELNTLSATEAAFSKNFAPFINEANVEDFARVFDAAITDIAANGNGKLINFDVALKTCFLVKKGRQ